MKGLVGFFDILGYQSFLENNSASESALSVLDIINDTPKQAKANIEKATKADPDFEGVSKALTHLVFSDTIVFTLAYPENASADWVYLARIYLSVCSSWLTSAMFENGLPIRGVLHEGEFIIKEHCLAGKAIVEAYQLCSLLDFSGVVLSKSLGKSFIASQKAGAIGNDSLPLFNYLAPLKDGSEMKLVHANWLSYLTVREGFKKDAEGYVLSAFWAHQKDCPKSVDQKVHNTVKVMRKMLQNYELSASQIAKVELKK